MPFNEKFTVQREFIVIDLVISFLLEILMVLICLLFPPLCLFHDLISNFAFLLTILRRTWDALDGFCCLVAVCFPTTFTFHLFVCVCVCVCGYCSDRYTLFEKCTKEVRAVYCRPPSNCSFK